MSCPHSASTRSHLSQVRGSGLSLSTGWYRSKQMTTEVLDPVLPHINLLFTALILEGVAFSTEEMNPGVKEHSSHSLLFPAPVSVSWHTRIQGSSLYILTPITGILHQTLVFYTRAHHRLPTGTEAESSPPTTSCIKDNTGTLPAPGSQQVFSFHLIYRAKNLAQG